MNFSYGNIKIKKHEINNWIVVSAEVTNNTNKSYSAVLFRITIFNKNTPIAHKTVVINGFSAGQTRTFETEFTDIEYGFISGSLRCDIFPENAY